MRGVFDAELADLRRRAEALRRTALEQRLSGLRFWGRPPGPARDDPARTAAHSWGVNEITRPALHDPVLVAALAHPRLDPVLRAILDRPRAWGLKLLWAPQAVAYDLGWHRDIDHRYDPVLAWKPAANDHLQFNAALAPDDSFMLVPGSHRRPLKDEEAGLLAADGCAVLPGQRRIVLDPGDVVLMDAHAIHRGQAAAGAPRLSLHYSCQAQWVPLMPWGEPEDFARISSGTFIADLPPVVQPYYRRLRTADRAPTQHDWLVDHARRQGWTGTLRNPWPLRRRDG